MFIIPLLLAEGIHGMKIRRTNELFYIVRNWKCKNLSYPSTVNINGCFFGSYTGLAFLTFSFRLVIIRNQLMSLLYSQCYWAAMHAKSFKSIYVHPCCGRCCCTGWSPLTFVPALTSRFLPLQVTCFQWSIAIPNSSKTHAHRWVLVCACVLREGYWYRPSLWKSQI